MKKLLVALLVTAMAVTSLAGCGDKKEPATNNGDRRRKVMAARIMVGEHPVMLPISP